MVSAMETTTGHSPKRTRCSTQLFDEYPPQSACAAKLLGARAGPPWLTGPGVKGYGQNVGTWGRPDRGGGEGLLL